MHRRVNTGDGPPQTQLLRRRSPPALAHLGSAPAEGRRRRARLLSSHFLGGTFAATEEEVKPATTPRDTLTTYSNATLCFEVRLDPSEAKPPLGCCPTDKFPRQQGSRSVLPRAVLHRRRAGELLRLPHPHRSGPPPRAPSETAAPRLHSAAGTAARAALRAHSTGLLMSPGSDVTGLLDATGLLISPGCDVGCAGANRESGMGVAGGAQRGPQHRPPAGTQPALTPAGRAPGAVLCPAPQQCFAVAR